MCKFTNRLFVFVLLSLLYIELFVDAVPCSKKRKNSNTNKEVLDYDHDIYVDQRQKGEENLRLKMDGFFFGAAIPSSSDLMSIGDILVGELGEELMLGLSKDRNKTSEPLSLFSFKDLNSKTYKRPANTQKMEINSNKDNTDKNQGLESDVFEQRDISRSKLGTYRLLQLLGKLQKE